MNETELTRIVDAWIAGTEAEEGTPAHKMNWWAISQVMDWSLVNGEHEKLWHFILMTYKRDISPNILAVLAAGPLEDLLVYFGPDYIERVESLAREDARFNHLLGGVWRNAMTDDVWARVCALRKTTW